MPLAGVIMWNLVGLSGLLFDDRITAWVLFVATGSIVYLGMFLSKFTGEDFMNRSKPRNVFDHLFLNSVAMCFLVYSIAIPFFLIDHTSLPLSVGILTGLMWLIHSWIINHWIGYLHTLLRTAGITGLWYLFPEMRFITIPLGIVFVYILSIIILEHRWQKLQQIDFTQNTTTIHQLLFE